MSYKCEHGKNSDVCVQCWEEKNSEPIIMNEQIELQKVVETPRTEAAKFIIYDEYEQIIDVVDPEFARGLELELLSTAKQLSALQVENEVLKVDNYALNRAMEDWQDISDSLTAALKECAEALNDLACVCTCDRPTIEIAGGGVKAPGPHTSQCVHSRAKKALSNSHVQKLLKP